MSKLCQNLEEENKKPSPHKKRPNSFYIKDIDLDNHEISEREGILVSFSNLIHWLYSDSEKENDFL